MLLCENFCISETFPDCGSPCLGWGFWLDYVSASLDHFSAALLFFVVEAQFFRSFSEEIFQYTAVIYWVSRRR